MVRSKSSPRRSPGRFSALKVAYANAAVAGKRLAVFSEAGFSPPAEKWASAASIPFALMGTDS